jgi:uncharacterized repeat protein (TIGR01451 family)
MLVKFRKAERAEKEVLLVPGAKALNELNSKHGVSAIKAVTPPGKGGLSRIYKLELPENANVREAIADYANNPSVEYAEPNYIYKALLEPNDPKYVDNTQWAIDKINATFAWNTTNGSDSIVIAVIDTGVDWDHPDLADNIWNNTDEDCDGGDDEDSNGYIDDCRGWDFVDSSSSCASGEDCSNSDCASGEDCSNSDNDPVDFHGHGTHCSGIASAVSNNSVGVVGTCWDCKIMPIRSAYEKTTTGDGWFPSASLINSLHYAADNGADVISMSFGGGHDSSMEDAIEYAYSKGAVLVGAGGNDYSLGAGYPAGYFEVIAVSSSDSSDSKSGFSNYGSVMDVTAPGSSIYNTYFDDVYGTLSGTSMATPHVAGLVGLILSKNSSLSEPEVRSIIRSTTDAITGSVYYGVGRIDAYKALQRDSIVVTDINFTTDGGTSLDDYSIGYYGAVGQFRDVNGTASGDGFKNYTLYAGFGNYPSAWTELNSSTSEINGGVLGNFNQTKLPLRTVNSLGETDHNCSNYYYLGDWYNTSVYSIDAMTFPSPLEINDTFNITVYWTGWHYTDANHWGIFLNDSFIGSCETYEDDDTSMKLVTYNNADEMAEDRWRGYAARTRMRTICNATVDNSFTEGQYELTVTANDYLGYCNPGESNADDESTSLVNLGQEICYSSLGSGICQVETNNCTCITRALNDSENCSNEVRLSGDVSNEATTCIADPANFSNKILDCQGHTIDGTDNSSANGAYLSNKENISIENRVFQDWGDALEFILVNDSTVYNNTFYSNTQGVEATGLASSTLAYNNFTNNTYTVELINSPGNIISYNDIMSAGQYGIDLQESNRTMVLENTVLNSTDSGIFVTLSSHVRIVGNNASLGFSAGIDLQGSYNITAWNNTLKYNLFEGISVINTNNSNLTGNNVSYNQDIGLYYDGSYSGHVDNNIFCYNGNYDISGDPPASGDNTCDWVSDWADDSVAVGCANPCRTGNLTITKEANVTNASIGQNFNYTITINNTDGTGRYNVNLTDILNATCLAYISASPENDSATLFWSIGNLSPDSGINTYKITANATSVCSVNNTATLREANIGELNASDLTDLINYAPTAENVTLTSSDPLNRTNGTLTASWVHSDRDGRYQTVDNETIWYNDSVLVDSLNDSLNVLSGNLTKGENWTVSVRVSDGIEWSNWTNRTIAINNALPNIEPISDITVRETGDVLISVNASDIDTGDSLEYYINSTLFTQSTNNFTWTTNLSSVGSYVFAINVSDGEDNSTVLASVTVNDATDFDGDDNPDFNDTDDDNDGLNDTDDNLLGNLSDVVSNVNITVLINGTNMTNDTYEGNYTVNITNEDNETVIIFDWNFNQTLMMNWTIDYDPLTGEITIRGVDPRANTSKTVYVGQPTSVYDYVCIADDEITNASDLDADCDCTSCTRVACSGSSGQYRCTDSGPTLIVSGLSHSAVKPVKYDPKDGGGGGGSSGGSGGVSSSFADPNRILQQDELPGDNESDANETGEEVEKELSLMIMGVPKEGIEFSVVVLDGLGNPVENATVTYINKTKLTGKDGKATFIALGENATIKAEKEGYPSATEDVFPAATHTTKNIAETNLTTKFRGEGGDDQGLAILLAIGIILLIAITIYMSVIRPKEIASPPVSGTSEETSSPEKFSSP